MEGMSDLIPCPVEFHPVAWAQLNRYEQQSVIEFNNIQDTNDNDLTPEKRAMLAKLKSEHQICFNFQRDKVRTRLLELNIALRGCPWLSHSTPYDDLTLWEILNNYRKRNSLLKAAVCFAFEMNPTTQSEFSSFVELAMQRFDQMRQDMDEYNRRRLHEIQTVNMTPKQKNNFCNKLKKDVGILPGVDIDDFYWKQLESQILDQDGNLAHSQMEELKIFYGDLCANGIEINPCLIDGTIDDNECLIACIKDFAANRSLSFSSLPATINHFVKHGRGHGKRISEYIEMAQRIVADSVGSTIRVCQDGIGRRFVFEYGFDSSDSGQTRNGRTIVLERNGLVWLMTCHDIVLWKSK